jgi:hypothetical protein
VRLDCGGSEKFKTKVAENQDVNPEFEQAFLFNIDQEKAKKGEQSQLHLKVKDDQLLGDAYIGRFDHSLVELLRMGTGELTFTLHHPENFRRIAGRVVISVKFEGTGAPVVDYPQQQQQQISPYSAQSSSPTPPPTTHTPAPAANPTASGWNCQFCTFLNTSSSRTCEMCQHAASSSVSPPAAVRPAVVTPPAYQSPSFDLANPASWPICVNVTSHPHPLFQKAAVYQGKYICDVCKTEGHGITFHCQPCQFDCHPSCAQSHQRR